MSMISELEALGVNASEALARFMNNEALYERMLKKYPDAAAKARVAECFAAGEVQATLEAAHTLKGVTGNLSLTPLYKAYSDIVALLREGKPQDAEKLYEDIRSLEEEIIGCIESGG